MQNSSAPASLPRVTPASTSGTQRVEAFSEPRRFFRFPYLCSRTALSGGERGERYRVTTALQSGGGKTGLLRGDHIHAWFLPLMPIFIDDIASVTGVMLCLSGQLFNRSSAPRCTRKPPRFVSRNIVRCDDRFDLKLTEVSVFWYFCDE